MSFEFSYEINLFRGVCYGTEMASRRTLIYLIRVMPA